MPNDPPVDDDDQGVDTDDIDIGDPVGEMVTVDTTRAVTWEQAASEWERVTRPTTRSMIDLPNNLEC